MDDALGVLGDVRLVRDEDDRAAVLLVELLERPEDDLAGSGVEVAGRFVGEDQGRVVDEGARDGDALDLPAGEFVALVHEMRFDNACRKEGSCSALLALFFVTSA